MHNTDERRERGMVTAELAVVAPFGVALTLLLLWIVSLGLTQVRLVDASREAARVMARGESVAQAEAVARAQAPDGATVSASTDDGIVTVRVEATSRLPVPFFEGIGARRLEATAVAAQESP